MWFFNAPRIIFGRESIDQLENPLNVTGKKAFIITDKDIIKLGMIDLVTARLKTADIEYEIFDEVLPDPPVSIVKKGAERCKAYQPDLLIALGGGSAIDAAKGIWVLYESDDDFDITGLNPFITIPTGTKARLIAIPTTSGTGAETTSAVVLTDDITGSGLKLELLNKFAIPSLAIVDPIFVDKMPKKLVSSTAFDAIAHCMEGISGKWTNIYTEGLAVLAMRLIFDNLEKSYKDADPDAREAVHNAATIAGLSFGNAQAHFGHSIGHQLGAVWHVPHGFAVGMVLPYLMKFLMNNDAGSIKAFASLAKATGKADWNDDDATAAKKLLVAIKVLQGKMDFPTKLTDVGITKEKVDSGMEKFKELILQSGAITICPVNVDQEVGAKIITYMVSGKEIDF